MTKTNEYISKQQLHFCEKETVKQKKKQQKRYNPRLYFSIGSSDPHAFCHPGIYLNDNDWMRSMKGYMKVEKQSIFRKHL